MTFTKHPGHRALAVSLLIATLALLLVAAPTWAEEDEGSAWDVPLQAFDVVFMRPVGLALSQCLSVRVEHYNYWCTGSCTACIGPFLLTAKVSCSHT